MTRRVVILPAADRDIDEPADDLGLQASLETVLRFLVDRRDLFPACEVSPASVLPTKGVPCPARVFASGASQASATT